MGKNTYGFEVGEYDKNRELIIDPVVLAYSTYLGGTLDEWHQAIAVDGSGCAYVTGTTYSWDFPTLNQYQANHGWSIDAIITRLVLCRETPLIELSRSSLYFGAVSGGSQTGPQTVSVGIRKRLY